MKIFAILEWDIKERCFQVIESSTLGNSARVMKMRYKVMCSRYPNNSFVLVEAQAKTLSQKIVHTDAFTKMRLEEQEVAK